MEKITIKRNYLFFPDKEKDTASADGYKPDAKLRMRVRWNKQKADFNLGCRVKLTQWDSKAQRCLSKTTNLQKQSASLINGKIQKFEDAIEAVFSLFELKGHIPSAEEIKSKFGAQIGRVQAASVEHKGLFHSLQEFTNEMGNLNNWTAGTFTKFKTLENHLKGFKSSLTFTDLTESGLAQYVNYLQHTAELRNSSTTKNLSYLKWFLRWATAKQIRKTIYRY